MKKKLIAAAVAAALVTGPVAPAAAHSTWIDKIDANNWVCDLFPVFC